MADITAGGFNNLRTKISNVLGVGAGSRGYGQNVYSQAVNSGELITKDQYDRLRYDIVSIWIHQTGQTPSAVVVQPGQLIDDGAGDPIQQYDTIINIAESNRFDIAPGQLSTSVIDNPTYSSDWTDEASTVLTCTFADANQARYFYNSGGKIRITATLEGHSETPQTNQWAQLLSDTGQVEFGANIEGQAVNFHDLTTDYQIIKVANASSPYAVNGLYIEAKKNSAGNIITIRVRLVDAYVDPDIGEGFPATENPNDGVVDGTLTITFEEIKASGLLQPQPQAGNFTITSPSYSTPTITAT
jgi:hypothetical protein